VSVRLECVDLIEVFLELLVPLSIYQTYEKVKPIRVSLLRPRFLQKYSKGGIPSNATSGVTFPWEEFEYPY
jgi:hypothetical protein